MQGDTVLFAKSMLPAQLRAIAGMKGIRRTMLVEEDRQSLKEEFLDLIPDRRRWRPSTVCSKEGMV